MTIIIAETASEKTFLKSETIMRKIKIGRTENGAEITICKQCAAYGVPHFNYKYGSGSEVSFYFDKPMLVDSMENLELSDRRDLQKFLTPENWEQMISEWNQNNKAQLSSCTHIQYYVNLQQYQDKAIVTTKEESSLLGAVLYVGTGDQDQRPHFHYGRNNSSDVAISLSKPEYMLPVGKALSDDELTKLIDLLEKVVNGESLYRRLIEYWNCQNQTEAVDVMPAYRTMKIADKDRG